MKTKSCFFALVLLSLTITACAPADKGPSASDGEKLFNDPQLAGSVNASSCATCHPGGKGLEHAFENPKLVSVINTCITGPLEGRALEENSAEMQSLKLYVESIEGE
ncbi:cytochrome-c peroxidase [Prosthecochloris sp. SCSIO W1102]|uniref:hypothetical protein n=1 Tax=Prosthecochloris sp. SCSIO W1102 TaxID=2992243 RepID=UPI00223D8CB2|nr:hypothetical protein [Prosthecochloris sp. SCSIO W1102]UZJ39144.1 cytochrome-c peroxidase [Prosthecochloris sp. SCSIO W1102]